MPYIRVENDEKRELDQKAEGDEEVSNKSLPSNTTPAKVEAASTTKMEVAEEVKSQVEMATAHTPPEIEEVTSQATLEMSVEDESVQDEDPFAEQKKEVLHDLEVVANEKDAKHALMEKLKSQIRQLEVNNVGQQMLF